MNTMAAISFFLTSVEYVRISYNRYMTVHGPMMYINRSVYSVLDTISMINGITAREPT